MAEWYRCPSCGHAAPDYWDSAAGSTATWTFEKVPCDTCGSHDVVLCPSCQTDYDPLGSQRRAVPAGSPPEPVQRPAAQPHPLTWPPPSDR